MYIRRKVFSVALDESGEERYFSTNEIINEEAYLDELMYSDDDDSKKMSTGKKAALGTAGAAGLAGAGIYGAYKYGGSQLSKAAKIQEILEKNRLGGKLTDKELKIIDKYANEKGGKKIESMLNRGEKAQKPGKWIADKTRLVSGKVRSGAGAAGKWAKAHPYAAAGIGAAGIIGTGGAIYGAKKLRNKD